MLEAVRAVIGVTKAISLEVIVPEKVRPTPVELGNSLKSGHVDPLRLACKLRLDSCQKQNKKREHNSQHDPASAPMMTVREGHRKVTAGVLSVLKESAGC